MLQADISKYAAPFTLTPRQINLPDMLLKVSGCADTSLGVLPCRILLKVQRVVVSDGDVAPAFAETSSHTLLRHFCNCSPFL
jgi:hypothetical protein